MVTTTATATKPTMTTAKINRALVRPVAIAKMERINYEQIFQIALECFLLFALISSQLATSLDSPIKIQRNKQQQQQIQYSKFNLNNLNNNSTLKTPSLTSGDSFSNEGGDRQPTSHSSYNDYDVSNNTSAASNSSKIDRVRRTNSEQQQQASLRAAASTNQASQQLHNQHECPTYRLIQSLLPPDYLGSPAASQRPMAARAHCECTPDPLGWHVTCFSGPSQFGDGGEPGNSHNRVSSSMSSPVSNNIPTLSQLHPAFRTSQAARQQQQQNQQHHQQMLAAAASNDLTFQAIPVLFSVKYLRNNMIEIDCDQAVPNYKAAMFRGFNVNEISSFTFNNCQLPNIPFSVLLHRTASVTRMGVEPPSTAGAGQSQAAGGGSNSGSRLSQSLKPNRQRSASSSLSGQPTNSARRRRQLEGEASEETPNSVVSLHNQGDQQPVESRSGEPRIHWQQQAGVRGTQSVEPRVRSLVINLNAVVDQRTLISLLTGLDLLEDLQLNYMQLNLTNFLDDLHITPTSTVPTTITTSTTAAASNRPSGVETLIPRASSAASAVSRSTSGATVGSSTDSADEMMTAADVLPKPKQQQAPGSNGGTERITSSPPLTTMLANSAPTRDTTGQMVYSARDATSTPSTMAGSPSTTSTTTTTSTSTTTTSTTTTTTSTTTTTTTTTPAPTTINLNLANLRPPKKQQFTTSIATTTAVTSSTVNNPTNPSSPVQMGSSSTKPSISMGAARGLLIAQATGPTPLATTTSGHQATMSTISNMPLQTSVPSAQSSAPTTTLTSTPTNAVGNSAATVKIEQSRAQTTLAVARQQQQQQAAPPTTPTSFVTITTTGRGPSGGQSQQTTVNGSNNNSIISIGTSQSHSVSYTSQTNLSNGHQTGSSSQTVRNQPGMFHLTPTTTPAISLNTQRASTPPTSSSLISTSTSLSSSAYPNNNGNNLSPNRLHQTPSAWFAASGDSGNSGTLQTTTPLVAGSRLSMSNNNGANVITTSVTNGQGSENHLPRTSSPFNWAAVNTPPATTTISSNFNGLNAPVNTPPFTPQPPSSVGNAFGFRTNNGGSGGQPGNLRTTSTVSQSSPRHQQLQAVSESTLSTVGNQQEGFVTAGGRLHANNQRRLHPAGATTSSTPSNNQQNSNRFASSFTHSFATSGSRPTSDEDFVLNGSHDFSTSAGNEDFGNDDLMLESSAASPAKSDGSGLAPNVRRKRWVSATTQSLQFEEFELSFGEILPNLRTLKLESFIDLSSIIANSGNDNNVRARTTGQSNAHFLRFKRQFKPSDLPEKDELSEFESESSPHLRSSNNNRDSLTTEESSFHHNSVMASAAATDSSGINGKPGAHHENDIDIEPGETLWRSASDSGRDGDENDAGVRVRAPPAAMANGFDDQPGESTQLSAADLGNATAQIDFSSQLDPTQVRVRQYSALILNKMFSRLGKLRVLQLTSNEIPYWPDNVLQDSRHSLVRLYLISNNLRQLGPKSLAQLGHLQILDFSSNQLRQMAPDLLKDLTNLQQLRATRNLFRRLPLKLMSVQSPSPPNATATTAASGGQQAGANLKALSRLESVDFSKNKYLNQLALVEQINHRDLNLAPIISLNLSDCALTDQFLVQQPSGSTPASSLPAGSFFAALTNLVNISLRNNKFRDLLMAAGLFGKNKLLQRLDLSHNQLQKVNNNLFNANASSLVELKLNHNQLSDMPEQFLFNLRKLRHLSLAHNRIKQLNTKMFLTNQLIESIDLSHNQLVTLNTRASGQIPFGNGANLRHLNLAHNNLSQFESDVFEIAWSFYTNLITLDLSHNKFANQIQMPIFYTIQDEMLLSLAHNKIQSVSVEALVQHEQVLDRYATSFETLTSAGGDSGNSGDESTAPPMKHSDFSSGAHSSASNSRVPTVNIRLANNPLACDCMLEPLISYTRRVAAATNPALLATLFPSQAQSSRRTPTGNQPRSSIDDATLPASSRYSVLSSSPAAVGHESAKHDSQLLSKQLQVLYQFKFNDLYCDKPNNLHRRLLSHISIGDLLCPIRDERLCPRRCECHYQSAFKTVIVDCNGRKLTQVPEQLTNAANFLQFDLETAFNLSSVGHAGAHNNIAEQANYGNRLTITNVDKMIIRLDNNRLNSMEPLSSLLNVVSTQTAATSEQQPAALSDNDQFGPSSIDKNLRFARAPSRSLEASRLTPEVSGFDQPIELDDSFKESFYAPTTESAQHSSVVKNKRISPVVAARRNMSTELGSHSRQRSRRQASGNTGYTDNAGVEMIDNAQELAHSGSASPTHLPISTNVLESAEEFRNKRYLQQTCELYLDHNMIDTIPDSFLSALDQVRASSMQAVQTPPQAALPSAMLEPPVHTKLNHYASGTESGSPSHSSSASDPMRASASNLHIVPSSSGDSEISADQFDAPPVSPLFGRQPFAAEKKAALMETINQNVRLSRLQQLDSSSAASSQPGNNLKVSVSPSLAVLSLRYNNLANISARMLNRLSKLIRSTNTKLYLGHNPFNCSDNYKSVDGHSLEGVTNSSALLATNRQRENNVIATPMGDQLLSSSDSVSGAFLEPAPDDLATSASSDSSATNANSAANQPLTPADCPIGQLKTWLTSLHSNVGDLDEIYCVYMPVELAEKLRLAAGNYSAEPKPTGQNGRLKARNVLAGASQGNNKWDHDHPWTSSLMSPALTSGAGGSPSEFNFINNSHLQKNGLTWNADLLMATAKLIDVDLYDMCPYSGIQLLDSSAVGYLSAVHQQALITVAIVFILISICLLLMLIYFGDTQTILAFVYIHMNPIYSCLHLNESHLDGEKLYDAFVSYSSADRDIVMELIARLEQNGNYAGDNILSKGTNLDRSRDTLVTEADLKPNLGVGAGNGLGTLQRRSTSTLASQATANSFSDLGTMSRPTSRVMLAGDETGASPLDYLSSPRPERLGNLNETNNSALVLNDSSSELVPSGQQKAGAQRPYRLCIHERDWLPGHLISWNIVNSVQNSRRTILILSKEFIKSVWFQVEFHTAYYQMLEDKIDRLIVIVRGELPPKHELDKNLAFLLTTKTYLTWGEKWFWERLHYALPHRAGHSMVSLKNHTVYPSAKKENRTKRQQKISTGNGHKPLSPAGNQTLKYGTSAADLLSSLAAGHADPPQKPLVMSNIGKDCSNLLLPGTANRLSSGPDGGSSSSTSSTSGSSGLQAGQPSANGGRSASASASSFLSGSSSTNQLFKTDPAHVNDHTQMMTTSNEMLSSPIPKQTTLLSSNNNTTRLSIGGSGDTGYGMRSSSPIEADSGRLTADRLSTSQLSVGQKSTSGGITSIMLDGGASNVNGRQANSKLRAKKQEKMQSFVDKEISNHFNLSEL